MSKNREIAEHTLTHSQALAPLKPAWLAGRGALTSATSYRRDEKRDRSDIVMPGEFPRSPNYQYLDLPRFPRRSSLMLAVTIVTSTSQSDS